MVMRLLSILLAGLLLSAGAASAATYSLVDERHLPLQNVNDPLSHENEPITSYSFEQLDEYMWNSPGFLRWNDGKRVCSAMRIMFGKASSRCSNLPRKSLVVREPDVFVSPVIKTSPRATSKAHVRLDVRRPTRPQVVHVSPVYPPFHNVWYPYR